MVNFSDKWVEKAYKKIQPELIDNKVYDNYVNLCHEHNINDILSFEDFAWRFAEKLIDAMFLQEEVEFREEQIGEPLVLFYNIHEVFDEEGEIGLELFYETNDQGEKEFYLNPIFQLKSDVEDVYI